MDKHPTRLLIESDKLSVKRFNLTKKGRNVLNKIDVLGTSTWGIALGRMLANTRHDVVMWSAIEKEIDNLSSTRIHTNLPKILIPGKANIKM